MYSIFLSRRSCQFLISLAPFSYGGTLATIKFAKIASVKLATLFIFWTPSVIIWWQADDSLFAALVTLYATSWLLLIGASFHAGAEVQSGKLSWMSLLRHIKPVFPDMPTQGLFNFIKQPIYLTFALTAWTMFGRPTKFALQLC